MPHITMSFRSESVVFAFVCLWSIGFIDANQVTPNNFISSYDKYEFICHKMGWEPKCRKHYPTGCSGEVIAFHATLTKTLRNVPQSTIIKFEKVLINQGRGYDPTTGKFTAPVDGVYSFSWTYCTEKGTTAYLSGFVDGKLMAKISNHSQVSAWQNTSGHLVIKLKKGSKFWVQNISGITSKLIHEDYTFVSGFKLSAC
ncbi:heavy metal-binding protein HIP-like isoform X2 [Crassostrea virginica]